MADHRERVHPYIPNLVPDTWQGMLAEVGVHDADELYSAIPRSLRMKTELDLPAALSAEYDLRREMETILRRNRTCKDNLSFLGGGCWQHFVPAVCDEIASRGEFLTGYHDGPLSMLGSYQAQFEFQSMLGELVGMDMVSTTTYDWGTAAASGALLAARLSNRTQVLVPSTISPLRLAQLKTLCAGQLTIRTVDFELATGVMSLENLEDAVSAETAAVYVEVPSYLGFLEPQVQTIADTTHASGGLFMVGVDPSSLGVLAAPSTYGADIVCGELQPLGIHMYYGGGHAGFIATPHEERYIAECPTLLVSILATERAGAYAFDWANFEGTSYSLRGESRDFAGTTQTIWAIVAAVYLATMGPRGMQELGELIMRRSQYAIAALSKIPGLKGSVFSTPSFKEFVVSFEGTSKTVREVNRALLEAGIFGGKDLSHEFPSLGQSALYCVTEIHRYSDIDRLVSAIREIVE